MRRITAIITAKDAVINMWIHEDKDWTNFTWSNDVIATKLANTRHLQGRLLGRMENLGFELKNEATLSTLTNDVIKSAAIEGETLAPDEVRSSIARRLGLDIGGLISSSRDVEGIVAMMLDATQNYSKPLTKERLLNWHAALFPTGRSGMHFITTGAWRTIESGPMQVVSGHIGLEKVHFEAPCADRIDSEMDAFLTWFNQQDNTDPVLKAGIAHLWFITIHPFEDGNGRIGRAIADMALARSDAISDRFYSLSTQIERERKQYYNHLEWQQRGSSDITHWLNWFLNCLERAMTNAEKILGRVLFKAALWNKINNDAPINDRQKLIINRMLTDDFEGYMNTSKYAKLAKCSTDTALRDIQLLQERGIFIQNPSSGRSTSYKLPDEIT